MGYNNTLKETLENFHETKNSVGELSNKFLSLAKQFLYGGYLLLNKKEKIYLREIEFYYLNIDGNIDEEKMYRKKCHDDDWLKTGTFFPHNSGIDITFEDYNNHLYRASILIRAFDLYDMNNQVISLDNNKSLDIYDMLLSRCTIFDGISIEWINEWIEPVMDVTEKTRKNLNGNESNREWNFRREENLFSVIDKNANHVFFSSKVFKDPKINKIYEDICKILDRYEVKHGLLEDTNDIWCRDYMPIQIMDNRFVQYIYNPDYLKNNEFCGTITDPSKVCDKMEFQRVKSKLIIDGGNIIRTPKGVIMTRKAYFENKSSVANCEKHMEQKEFESHFYSDFGVNKITWLKWDRNEIYGHADGIVRYIGNNQVLMTNYSEYDSKMAESFRKSLEDDGYKVYELHFQKQKDIRKKDDLSWSYINFLQTSKVIIVPFIGQKEEDEEALKQIKELFKDTTIVGINARDLLIKEGGFNCFCWTVKV